MKQILRGAWLVGLRSGEHTQGRGCLEYVDPLAGIKRCCLGVLCRVAIDLGYDVPVVENDDLVGTTAFDGLQGDLTDRLMGQFGLDGDTAATLVCMNDGHDDTPQHNFREIADWIEENIPVEAAP